MHQSFATLDTSALGSSSDFGLPGRYPAQQRGLSYQIPDRSLEDYWYVLQLGLLSLSLYFDSQVGREIPVAGIPSDNYCPGKYFKFGQSGKYDILELILLNIQSSFFKVNIKFKLIAYNCYPLHAYHANKVMQWTTSAGS